MPQITERVYHIRTHFFVNFYLVKGDEGLTLIDTGMSAKATVQALSKALKDLDATWQDIQSIIITHAHFDHVGGLHAVQTATQALTYAHPADTPIIEGKQQPIYANPIELGIRNRIFRRFVSGNEGVRPAEVDMIVDEGDELENIAPSVQVIHLPGHSYGQIGLWLPDERTLIAGDAMMYMPWGLTNPPRVTSSDWADVYRSIERIAKLAPDNLCLGHGTPIKGNASQLVQQFYERWQNDASL